MNNVDAVAFRCLPLVNGRCSHVSTIEESVLDVVTSSRNKSERNRDLVERMVTCQLALKSAVVM